MTTVADLARWLEGFAPSRLAESWDNVGLLFGDPLRHEVLVGGAGAGGRLLNQFAEVFPHNGDTLVYVGDIQKGIGHRWISYRLRTGREHSGPGDQK